MSTYVYMRLLESAPHRYDRGIQLLSFGHAGDLYRRVAQAAVAGGQRPRILEIGCGTGNLTRALAEAGAAVTAVDWNAAMLEVAKNKLSELGDRVELREMAAVEIADRFAPHSFDAVASTLTFSEMSPEGQAYVLEAVHRLLRPRGRLVVGDEVRPKRVWQRFLYRCARWPLAALTYLFTQTTTHAVRDLPGMVRRAGFDVVGDERSAWGSTAIIVATAADNGREGEER